MANWTASLNLRSNDALGVLCRFVAVDDCGNIINPMIVDGQIHGGLAMGLAPALLEEIVYNDASYASFQTFR